VQKSTVGLAIGFDLFQRTTRFLLEMKRVHEPMDDANPKRRRLNVRSWLSSTLFGLLVAVGLDQFYFVPPTLTLPARALPARAVPATTFPTPAKIKSLDWNYTRYKEATAEKVIVPEWVRRCIASFNEKRLFESELNESYVLNTLRTRDSYPIHPSRFSVQTLNHDDFSIRIIDCYLL
jgi:hypothetical protein